MYVFLGETMISLGNICEWF